MTVAQVIETHTGCDYWVTGVGFVPGAFMSYAMEPAKVISAPLYRTPRTWTHARLLNFGGTTSTIYRSAFRAAASSSAAPPSKSSTRGS